MRRLPGHGDVSYPAHRPTILCVNRIGRLSNLYRYVRLGHIRTSARHNTHTLCANDEVLAALFQESRHNSASSPARKTRGAAPDANTVTVCRPITHQRAGACAPL